jgi:hypothetical protein
MMSVTAEKGTSVDVCDMGRVMSGLGVCLSSEEACVRGQGGGAVRGFDDRRRRAAADEQSTGDGRVAQRVSSAAWASAGWPMAGRGGRAISRAGQLQRGLGGGEVDGVW